MFSLDELLSESERWTLINALSTAEQFYECSGAKFPELAAAFTKQAAEARLLRRKIEVL